MAALLTKFNFLLAFADANYLEQLRDTDRMMLVKKIVANGPSEKSWRALLELFASWNETSERARALEWADMALESWNDEVRHINSSWTYLYDGDKLSFLGTIARSVSINRREQNGNRELISIVNSDYASKIRTLVINRSEIYIEGLRSLTTSIYLRSLRSLALEGVTLGDNELSVLFNASNMPQLESLRLKDTGINIDRVRVFISATLVGTIKNLDLSFNNLDDEVVMILTNSDMWKALETLNLNGNYLKDEGARTLMAAGLSNRLRELNLSGNEISSQVKEDLRKLSGQGRLKIITEAETNRNS